jgi:uncharacterized protein (DUF58 family)
MPADLEIDPKLLVALDDLSLVAEGVVEGFLGGLHRSPFLGYSTEFATYRPYIQGDNLRYVDWKVWARTDELYVKQFEDDTNVLCQIFLDTSASMDFGIPGKFAYGRLIAAALAYLMVKQHDAPGLILFGQKIEQALPARSGRHHLDDIFHTLKTASAGGQSLAGGDLGQIAHALHRRGLAAIISDFFSTGDKLFELLRQLHFHRQEIIVFHVLSPEELDLTFEGNLIMQDQETGEEIPVQANEYREEYQRRLGEFNQRLQNECAKYEAAYRRLRTDEPLDRALIAYLEQRAAVA